MVPWFMADTPRPDMPWFPFGLGVVHTTVTIMLFLRIFPGILGSEVSYGKHNSADQGLGALALSVGLSGICALPVAAVIEIIIEPGWTFIFPALFFFVLIIGRGSFSCGLRRIRDA